MIRVVLPLMVTSLLSGASAASEKLQVSFAPVSIDGTVTAKGAVTVSGRTYVLLDALRAQGVNTTSATTLNVYRLPGLAGRPTKLQGCVNEFLFNGSDRVKLSAPVWEGANNRWNIQLTVQAHSGGFYTFHFDPDHVTAIYKSGRTFSPDADPIQKAEMEGDAFQPGYNNLAVLHLQDPNDDGSDPLIKLILPPAAQYPEAGKGVLSFNLICQK